MSKISIGVDIGKFSIKVVEIIKTSTDIKLLSCGIKKIAKEAGIEEQAATLKSLFKDAGVSSMKINSSVSGKDVIIRYAAFPVMPKKSLVYSLKFEYEKYIPFSLTESMVDVDILEKRPDGQMNVIIVSAKRIFVENRVRIIESAGLLPQLITTDSLALYEIFSGSHLFSKTDSFVLLNIGYSVTNLAIIKQGELIFSRDIGIGGDNFTHSIADKLGIPVDEAEQLKFTADTTTLMAALSIDLTSLINEIELSVAYSRKNHGLKNINAVYVSGGSSRLKGLTVSLEKSLEGKVEFWNPFTKVKKTEKFSILEDNYQELILALGIALYQNS